jgi:hypothetical protein
VDRVKIEAIEKLPYLRDIKGIRSFLEHAGFYRRFIKDFSKISKPLTNLLQNDVPFYFNDDCVESFNVLNNTSISVPIIRPPDWNLPFEIICDASDYAVGDVFGQRNLMLYIILVRLLMVPIEIMLLDECIFSMFLHCYFIKLSLSSSRIFYFTVLPSSFMLVYAGS